MMIVTVCRRSRPARGAISVLAALAAPLLVAGCSLSEQSAGGEPAATESAETPAATTEAGNMAVAQTPTDTPAGAPEPARAPVAEAELTKAAEPAASEAPDDDTAVGTKPAAAPDPLKPRREGVALAITARSTPPKSADAKDEGSPSTMPASLEAESRRWSLGHVDLRGPWKPVFATGEEAGSPGIYEFRTGTEAWVRATVAGFADVRIGEMTRARVSQWRFGDDEAGRLVIELTRGRVEVRPRAEQASGKARDVLVKTPAGDVVVREAVEVSYDAATGVRSRLPAN